MLSATQWSALRSLRDGPASPPDFKSSTWDSLVKKGLVASTRGASSLVGDWTLTRLGRRVLSQYVAAPEFGKRFRF